MRLIGVYVALFVYAMSGPAVAADDCIPVHATLLLDNCSETLSADLVLILDRTRVPQELTLGGEDALVVTGAYTNGERVEPEGLVIEEGEAFDPYVQGWDGVMLIEPEGGLSLHHVARVRYRGSLSNLRDKAQRRAFIARARQVGLSAIQSHMLITDGMLDVRPVEGAPRFRRRVVFSYEDGRYGIFDSGPRALTLFEAGAEIQADYDPKMAFNLDMGSYDYCMLTKDGHKQDCGALSRSATAKLSNVLVFRQD